MPSAIQIFTRNEVKSLSALVDVGSQGFIIPAYQRQYKWGKENISRLFEDILSGLNDVKMPRADDDTIFLGTFIAVEASNQDLKTFITNKDFAAPTGRLYIVDGQQRLSTVALIAISLHNQLSELMKTLESYAYWIDDEKTKIEDLCRIIEQCITAKLERFYCVEVSGNVDPKRKPIIVRLSQEFWIRNGKTGYKSPIARYCSEYIDTQKLPDVSKFGGSQYEILEENHSVIQDLVKKKLLKLTDMNFMTLQRKIGLAEILFDDAMFPDIAVFRSIETLEKYPQLEQLLNLSLFSLYLLNKCCVNYLEPKTHAWAIEVFQSLNSTGVPLTSIEVFRAYVMQNNDENTLEKDDITRVFSAIETLIEENKSRESLSDVYVTALALGYDGTKLGSKYRNQEHYLKKSYDSQTELANVELAHEGPFIKYMKHLAEYFGFRLDPSSVQNTVSDLNFLKIATNAHFNMDFLEAMNLNTTHPLLATFYDDQNPWDSDFLEACNATAAFYALWRATKTSSSLDDVARDLMNANSNSDQDINMSWNTAFHLKKDKLQQYKTALKSILARENILDKSTWVSSAVSFLTYQNSKVLCRYFLFLASHNTMVNKAGRLEVAHNGYFELLSHANWSSDSYTSVEHIAPQVVRKNDTSWDESIYQTENGGNIVHSIGNLTLLPIAMNSVLSNLNWQYKHKFYSYLANPSVAQREELLKLEGAEGVVNRYTKAAKSVLKRENLYYKHLEYLASLTENSGSWKREIINERTNDICSIGYDRLLDYLK